MQPSAATTTTTTTTKERRPPLRRIHAARGIQSTRPGKLEPGHEQRLLHVCYTNFRAGGKRLKTHPIEGRSQRGGTPASERRIRLRDRHKSILITGHARTFYTRARVCSFPSRRKSVRLGFLAKGIYAGHAKARRSAPATTTVFTTTIISIMMKVL
ncbi:uncharacterized protein B0I36DRAFT_320475 [Microdochium trichocladiopsis]|uniref:Uncharacterized protein n=1 Tax=Microdochium trichocladiopsis TaxID=1682393 RepID=A0A9P8Y6F2_9PEZI|nr:uncharacterized protein B0I36DRAFT_320475 [Microdochium trichocladiopsis]KAH7032970.1 hypothetical protein B0I36DRAFT_320475 [Microdochium trichocladiopsis]